MSDDKKTNVENELQLEQNIQRMLRSEIPTPKLSQFANSEMLENLLLQQSDNQTSVTGQKDAPEIASDVPQAAVQVAAVEWRGLTESIDAGAGSDSDSSFGKVVSSLGGLDFASSRSDQTILLFFISCGILFLVGLFSHFFVSEFSTEIESAKKSNSKTDFTQNVDIETPSVSPASKDENAEPQKRPADREQSKVKQFLLADGTKIVGDADSQFEVLGDRRISLSDGQIYLIVAKSDKPFIVKTDHGILRATGTRFTVSIPKQSEKENGTTFAAVAQGTVELQNQTGFTKLTAGEQGTLRDGKPPTREPAPRVSHLISWAKSALSETNQAEEKESKKSGLITVDVGGQETQLSLEKYHVDVVIENGIARTTIDQTFFNHNYRNTEGTFYLPLPPNASVSRLAMYVSGKLNEGGMVTRNRGQQIYTKIREQKRDPALLEKMEGNLYKLRIFPLEPRQERRIFLSYTQRLDELYGTIKYWFPMEHTNSIAKNLSIKIRIKGGKNRYTPHSSTHVLDKKIESKDIVLLYDAENIQPDQDLILSLLSEKEKQAFSAKQSQEVHETQSRFATFEQDGKQFLFGKIRPDLSNYSTPNIPRSWVVLNDISASRTDMEIRAQQHMIRRLISEADDKDNISVFDLNCVATPAHSEPVSVLSSHAKSLANRVRPQVFGGTNIEAGFEKVTEWIDQHKLENIHVVYMGDGTATDGESRLSALPDLVPRDSKFIGLGVGKNVDSLFLSTVANKTKGHFALINPDEDLNWRIVDLIASLNTASLHQVEILLQDKLGNPVEGEAYSSAQNIFDGETIDILARCNTLPERVLFRAKINNKTISKSYSLTRPQSDAGYIPRLWATRHINELLKSDQDRVEEITKLSKQYYVVTPYTSLIVLENDKMYKEFGVEKGRKDHWELYPAPAQIEVIKGNRRDPGQSPDNTVTERKSEIELEMQAEIEAERVLRRQLVQAIQNRLQYPIAKSHLGVGSDEIWLGGQLLQLPELEFTRAFNTVSVPDGGTILLGGIKRRMGRPNTNLALRFVDPNLNTWSRPQLGTDFYSGKEFFDQNTNWYVNGNTQNLFLEDGVVVFGNGVVKTQFSPYQAQYLTFGAPSTGFTPYATGLSANGRWLSTVYSDRFGFHSAPSFDFDGDGVLDAAGLESSDSVGVILHNFYSLPERGIEVENLTRLRAGNDKGFQFGLNSKNLWRSLSRARYKSINLKSPVEVALEEALNERMDFEFENISLAQALSQIETQAGTTIVIHQQTLEINPDIGKTKVRLDVKEISLRSALKLLLSRLDLKIVLLDGQIQIVPKHFRIEKLPVTNSQNLIGENQRKKNYSAGSLGAALLDQLSLQERLLRNAQEAKGERNQKMIDRTLSAIKGFPPKISKLVEQLELEDHYRNPLGNVPKFQPVQLQPLNTNTFYKGEWLTDITKFAPGLFNNASDAHGLFEAEWESKRSAAKSKIAKLNDAKDPSNREYGTVSEKDKQLVAEIRKNIPDFTFSQPGSNVVLSVASGNRIALRHRNEMYLKEEIVSDGTSLFHSYPELGLSAQRKATPDRIRSLFQFVPHIIPSPEQLTRLGDLAVAEKSPENVTLHLTAKKADKLKLRIEIVVNKRGEIQRLGYFDGNSEISTVDFQYSEGQLTQQFSYGGKVVDEEIFKLRYESLNESTFSIDNNKSIVFEMPLLKATTYQQRINDELKKNSEERDREKIASWRRHYALAFVESGVQANSARDACQKMILPLFESKENAKPKLGDVVLLGSAGYPFQQAKNQELFGKNYVADRQLMQSSIWTYYSIRQQSSSLANTADTKSEDLISHLTAYRSAMAAAKKSPATSSDRVGDFHKRFPRSPLALPLAHQSQQSVSTYQHLFDHSKYALQAMEHASNLSIDEKQKRTLAIEFWKQFPVQAGLVPISKRLFDIVAIQFPKKSARCIKLAIDRENETGSILNLRRIASLCDYWERIESREVCFDRIEDHIRKIDSALDAKAISPRLELAKTYWKCQQTQRAQQAFMEVIDEFKRRKIQPSTALYRTAARISLEAGDTRNAVQLELQSLTRLTESSRKILDKNMLKSRFEGVQSTLEKEMSQLVQDGEQAAAKELFQQHSAIVKKRFLLCGFDAGTVLKQATYSEYVTGDAVQARNYLLGIIDAKPKEANSYLEVANWLKSKNRLGEAEKWISRAAQWDTATPIWHYRHAEILKKLGRISEYREQLNLIVNGQWEKDRGYVNSAKAELKKLQEESAGQ